MTQPLHDTICALATPTGGALGIVRLSGPQAIATVGQLCGSSVTTQPAGTARLRKVSDGDATLDEAVVTIYKAPHSYTGEDSVELSCHGSPYILQRLLALLTESGCRMAEPGEFTRRAFLNGRLDLSQAEAVADLIAARSRAAHHAAISQLKGHFSSELALLRERLLQLTSLLELELDFSDHEDLQFADRNQLHTLAQEIEDKISALAHSFRYGKAFKDGIPVAIVGETNVGKSTLLNQLLGEERAIVSNVHGTTRDTIEDTADIDGVTFRFIDTAGLRQTDDTIEQIGIERTYKAVQKSAIVVWLTDQRPSNRQISEMQTLCDGKQLVAVQNKADLQPQQNAEVWMCPLLHISAKTGYGIEALKAHIRQAANLPHLRATDVVVSTARHYDALCQALKALRQARAALDGGLSAELVSEELRDALHALAEITGGEITSAETLQNIFSHFCVGK